MLSTYQVQTNTVYFVYSQLKNHDIIVGGSLCLLGVVTHLNVRSLQILHNNNFLIQRNRRKFVLNYGKNKFKGTLKNRQFILSNSVTNMG